VVQRQGLRRLRDHAAVTEEDEDLFLSGVVPLLQGAGAFRREYLGTTLRETMGLDRPRNRLE
jgi:hypothetical protein